MPETATTEMEAVMEIVTTTKNAIARGFVTISRDSSHARRRDRDVCGRETAGNTPSRTTVPDDRESKKRVHQRNRPV